MSDEYTLEQMLAAAKIPVSGGISRSQAETASQRLRAGKGKYVKKQPAPRQPTKFKGDKNNGTPPQPITTLSTARPYRTPVMIGSAFAVGVGAWLLDLRWYYVVLAILLAIAGLYFFY